MIKKPGKLKQYEKRFGLIAIEKGFITEDELIKALIIQVKEEIEEGRPRRHRLIGEILLDMGVISGKQVEEALMEIFR